jgi:hypothetical protein
VRAGRLRFSQLFYNPHQHFERVLGLLH